jgi:hypothetical protein
MTDSQFALRAERSTAALIARYVRELAGDKR